MISDMITDSATEGKNFLVEQTEVFSFPYGKLES